MEGERRGMGEEGRVGEKRRKEFVLCPRKKKKKVGAFGHGLDGDFVGGSKKPILLFTPLPIG